ncbi:putative transcriptional regulatory protein C11D3.07c 4, partial [Colletotrichum chlorophyti]
DYTKPSHFSAIRCDREDPCSHCQNAGIECKNTSGLKPKEKRTRILITPQYEKKIDQIDRRLDGVVRLLQDLKLQLPAASASTAPPSSASASPSVPLSSKPANSSISTPGSHVSSSQATGPMVEGESSMTAQSIFADDFLRKAVGDGSSILEMGETLDALHSLVDALKHQPASHEMTYPSARFMPRPSFADCEMPPVQSAVGIIREAKAARILGLQWIQSLIREDHFLDLCLKVYFAPSEFDQAEFIIVNAGLETLYLDMATSGKTSEQANKEYTKMGTICRANLETALANLPLHLPATMDMIAALLFGSYHAMEVAKPSLAWTLNVAAAQLCQTLGYHRVASVKNGNQEDEVCRMFLFWSVYFVDKSLSLRLGRPSAIQDYDITIPYPSSTSKLHGALMSYFCLWVTVAGIQGKTYEKLYSPEAIAQPSLVREARARGLAAELHDVRERTQETHAQHLKAAIEAIGENTMDFFNESDEVLRLSLLTIIYRAVPSPPGSPTTFGAECIEAARATLQRHEVCMAIMARDSFYLFPMYMNWTIHFAPFVPFIVIFCQVMETRDSTDLVRLQGFVTSIQGAKDFSEASARLCRLFQVLYNVAFRYVEMRNSSQQSEQAQASQEMDKYLTALGFPTAGQQPMEAGAGSEQMPMGGDGVNQTMWMGNAAQLEDWFYSNQQMLGLVEDDASFLQ